MNSPPRKTPSAGEQTGRKVIASLEYHALTFLAKVFKRRFWFFEQRHARLMDRLENERGGK